MKKLLSIIIIGCLAFQGISQIPKEIQDFDKSELSNRARSIIDTFENHRYNYYSQYQYRWLSDEKRNESFNDFHRFLTKEASLSDTKVFLNYPDKNYNRLAHHRLVDFGYTKIDLLKLLVNDTERVEPFYDCIIPPPNEPNWTKIGNYIHSTSKNYSEVEKDSIIEILFLVPNNLTRMKAHYLINLEDNSKHINWAIELGKRAGFYSVAIPLIKYRFEEEKDLILKLLKSWLFEAKERSTFWNYLSFHFDDLFKKIQNDKDVIALFYEYHKAKPNKFYANHIYRYIAFQKDTTSARVLRELYYSEKETTSKYYGAYDYIDNLATYALGRQTQDTIYKDLYFEIWFDNGDYRDNLPISYIKKQKPHEFDERIIRYFYNYKDVTEKQSFPRYIDHYISYYIETKKNKTKAKQMILDLINAKNDFVRTTILRSIYGWIDVHKTYDKDISHILFDILYNSDDEKSIEQAFFSIKHFNHLESNQKFITWYESAKNGYRNNQYIKKRYIELVRDDKKELCIKLLKKSSIKELVAELEKSEDIDVARTVFWASWRNKRTELFDVFAILVLKFNLWEAESIEYMYKCDDKSTEEIVFKYFDKGLSLKYPSLHNGYSGIEPLVKIYVENKNRDTVCSAIQKVLRTDGNGDIHCALKLIKGYGEKYHSYDELTIKSIMEILNNYRHSDKHYDCIVILSLDKKQHYNIITWYNKVLKEGVGQNEPYRNQNQFEFITRYLSYQNIILKNDK